MNTPAAWITEIVNTLTTIFPQFTVALVAIILLALGARLLRQFRVLGR
jgi:hypothetical protein